MQGRFQAVPGRRPPRSTLFGPSSGALGYLSRLDALSQAGHMLTPMEQRLLSIYKRYAHDPEVPIYVTEVLARHFNGVRSNRHVENDHYLYPLDAWIHDLTEQRGGMFYPGDVPRSRDPMAQRSLVTPEHGAELIRRDILDGTHFIISAIEKTPTFEGQAGIPEDPPEGGLVLWLAREISGLLKQIRKGRVVPVRAGALDEKYRMSKIYPVDHLDLPEREVRLDDAAVAMRQNLHDMRDSLRKVVDWHVQTGSDSPLYVTRFAVENGPRRVALPQRRQSEAQWAAVQLPHENQVKEGAPSWGSSTDVMAYSWSEAATAADEWHTAIGRMDDTRLYITVDMVESRMQRPGTVVSSDEETGWIAQILDTNSLLAAESSVLGHCIARGGYWEQIQAGTQQHLSIRSPVPDMEGRYRPRWTVHMDARRGGDRGWTVAQIKGLRDALPPYHDVEQMRAAREDDEFLDSEGSVETCRQIARLLEPVAPSYRAANDWVHCAKVIQRAEARDAQEREQARKRRPGLLEL